MSVIELSDTGPRGKSGNSLPRAFYHFPDRCPEPVPWERWPGLILTRQNLPTGTAGNRSSPRAVFTGAGLRIPPGAVRDGTGARSPVLRGKNRTPVRSWRLRGFALVGVCAGVSVPGGGRRCIWRAMAPPPGSKIALAVLPGAIPLLLHGAVRAEHRKQALVP